jgi:tRNA threonylcarbamoyladenosine biosynthesis protein TsaE
METVETTRETTASAEETRALGERLGRRLEPGDVVALYGGLGSGKTTLAQGICRGLGVREVVNSPTFTIVNEYRGRCPVYHLDCYRLEGAEDLAGLGCEEYFYGDGVCLIEWAEKAADVLPPVRFDVRCEQIGVERREIVIEAVREDENSGGGDGHPAGIDRPGR